MEKVPDKTPEIINTSIQTEPILTQPVKEHHVIFAEAATQTEVIPSYDLVI